MKKSDLNKNGRSLASIVRVIAWFNLIASVIMGLVIMAGAKRPGTSGYSGYQAGGTDESVIMLGVVIMIGGVFALVILLAIAYICEAVAQLHLPDQI